MIVKKIIYYVVDVRLIIIVVMSIFKYVFLSKTVLALEVSFNIFYPSMKHHFP